MRLNHLSMIAESLTHGSYVMFDATEERPFEILDTFEGQAVTNRGAEDALFALISEYDPMELTRIGRRFTPISEYDPMEMERIGRRYSIVIFRADRGIGGRMVAKGDKMWRTDVLFRVDEKDARDMLNRLIGPLMGRPLMGYGDWNVKPA